jgi:hypothetical protein
MARAALQKLDSIPQFYFSNCGALPSPEEFKIDGVQDTETGFRAYPNPNSGHLTLSYALQQDETGTLRIFTTVGTLIHQQQLMPTATVIDVDLSGLGNGMYLLSIDVDGEQRFAERVAIMKE